MPMPILILFTRKYKKIKQRRLICFCECREKKHEKYGKMHAAVAANTELLLSVFILHKSTEKATVTPPPVTYQERKPGGVLSKSWGVNHSRGRRRLPAVASPSDRLL